MKKAKPLITRRIESAMVMEGRTQKDMAKLFHVSRTSWCNWMRNPLSLTLYRLETIAAYLHTTPEELLRKE